MCSQGHPNLKEIGSSQTKHCINAYPKKIKREKKAAYNEQNNEQKMNKTGK